MSQNTLVIADGTGAQVLERMNNANNTLATLNSGSSAPSTTYAYMLWADTANSQLKMRNSANTAWIIVGSFDASTFNPQIADGLITEAKLASNAVTEAKIADNAVTTNKIADNSVSSSKFTDGSITNAKLATPFTAGTSWAYSGSAYSSINFTSIPNWVRKITICAGGMTTGGTSGMTIRVGKSGTIVSSADYIGASDSMGSGVAPHAYSTGFDIGDTTQAAGDHRSFTAVICKPSSSSNYYTFSLMGANTYSTNALMLGGGAIFLGSGSANILDSIRITTLNGTDVFDGGNVNIFYEG